MHSITPKADGDNQKVCYVTTKDLPLSCPMPNTRLWDSHPRIYLPITKTGYITCPYCGTAYQLTKESAV